MTLTPHSIVGAAIANLTPENPELGFALALASHYALDMIPHHDYDIDYFFNKDEKILRSVFTNSKARLNLLTIGFDFIIGVGICFLLFIRNRQSFIATCIGIFGGLLPDFFQFLYYKFKNEPFIFFQKIHDFFHSRNEMKDKPILGTLIQFVAPTLLVFIYFLLK